MSRSASAVQVSHPPFLATSPRSCGSSVLQMGHWKEPDPDAAFHLRMQALQKSCPQGPACLVIHTGQQHVPLSLQTPNTKCRVNWKGTNTYPLRHAAVTVSAATPRSCPHTSQTHRRRAYKQYRCICCTRSLHMSLLGPGCWWLASFFALPQMPFPVCLPPSIVLS
jgi:hypothetical protein